MKAEEWQRGDERKGCNGEEINTSEYRALEERKGLCGAGSKCLSLKVFQPEQNFAFIL